ncbi:iron-containing alcohol dehydrogenase [Beduini massiliensis]|uniref:iron-containing alcohol dehydrogenase n=1 Tax=Beduini massiliensis TaxID=1585974 RepID=UPI00059A7AFB|nr:iron-containing alcohol dehydrogenase [Beduini massiliensis]
MNDFQFQNTTKVYFGKDQLGHLHTEVLKFGDKVLVAHGGSFIRESLLYKRVINELQTNAVTVYELGEVEPNPRHTTVNKGVAMCKEHGIQTVLAIGGGSTIDCCKAIAAAALSETDNIWDLVEEKIAWKDALAVIAIPTIASTGSEMDKSCVISNVELGVKSGINGEAIRPKAAFLDPTNTFTVPPMQTACGGFDIMAHFLDMNYFVNADKYPLQFNVVETILKTVRNQLPVAIKEPENYEARATLLWAASWALNSFCTSGFKTQPQLHALEQFSSTMDLTHGLGLAIITPKWMTYLLERDETVADDFARFGVNVMGIPDSEDKKALAFQAVEALQQFIKDELGLPVYLSELGLDGSKFDEMTKKACYGRKMLPLAYRPLTQEDCLNIYKMCL